MFPLSKREKQVIRKLKTLADGQKMISLTDAEEQDMNDMLLLLCEREVLHAVNADNENWYIVRGDFDLFEKWVADQERKAKKLTRREWWIAIISAIIGALIGLLPSVIPYITKMLEEI